MEQKTEKTNPHHPSLWQDDAFIKKIITYALVILYYFFIASFVLNEAVVPLLAKHDAMRNLDAVPLKIAQSVGYDKDGISILGAHDFSDILPELLRERKQIDDTVIELYTVSVLGYVIYENDRFISVPENSQQTGVYVVFTNYLNAETKTLETQNELFEPSFNASLFNKLIQGKLDTWENGHSIHFYYHSSIFSLNHFSKQVSLFHPVSSASALFQNLVNFIYYVLLALPLVIYFFKDLKWDFKALLKEKEGLQTTGQFILYVFIISTAIGLLSSLAGNVLDLPKAPSLNQASINNLLSSNTAILMIVSATILGPFVEEFVFRRAFFSLIQNKYAALIISSLLFGFVHVSSEASLPYMIANGISYVGAGFLFGFLYIKTKQNVVQLYFIHAAYNFITIIVSLLR